MGWQVGHAGTGITITVTNNTDTTVAGEITLREAVELANATSGATIEFDPVFFAEPRVIQLSQGELLISSSMTLNGSGANMLTVDALDTSRTLTISNEDPSLIDVEINAITFTGGNGTSSINDGRGGCLHSFENLSLNDSVVTGCSSSTDGGGLWHRFGSFTMNGSTLHDNSTSFKGGGAYLRQSSNIITNSTISSNSASFFAGGLYVDGSIDIRLSTITNNISLNGNNGGLFVRNNATNLNKVIVGDNLGNSDIHSDSNTITVYDSVLGLVSNETTLIQSNTLTDTNPQLYALTNNGGSTPTHLPALTSPAINLGDVICAGVVTDQRGELRNDGYCDAGSVELTPNDDVIFKNGFD